MAMLLAEGLGEAAYTERVKIYATDVDEDALKTARLALYTDKEVQNVPEPLAHEVLRARRQADGASARTCDAR